MALEADYMLDGGRKSLLLLRRETLQKIFNLLRMGRAKAGSGLRATTTSDGTTISLPDGISVQTIEFCEGGVHGYRQVLCSDFKQG